MTTADEVPFMVVPHAPDQPLSKLRALKEAISELLFHLRKHVWNASALSSERQFSVLNSSDYKQVRINLRFFTSALSCVLCSLAVSTTHLFANGSFNVLLWSVVQY